MTSWTNPRHKHDFPDWEDFLCFVSLDSQIESLKKWKIFRSGILPTANSEPEVLAVDEVDLPSGRSVDEIGDPNHLSGTFGGHDGFRLSGQNIEDVIVEIFDR